MKGTKPRWLAMIAAVLLTAACAVHGADCHAARDGDDANPGTAQQPFRTVAAGDRFKLEELDQRLAEQGGHP